MDVDVQIKDLPREFIETVYGKVKTIPTAFVKFIPCVVLIGNSDDKLTQEEWMNFADETRHSVSYYAIRLHFSGCPSSIEKWQNYCIVFEMDDRNLHLLKKELTLIRTKYKQNSIAFISGETEFI